MDTSNVEMSLKFQEELQAVSQPATELVQGRIKEQPELFHYTTADGLVGILEQRKIRATYIQYLNDRTELDFAANRIRDVIKANMSRWPGAEAVVNDALTQFLDLRARTAYYVACFCA